MIILRGPGLLKDAGRQSENWKRSGERLTMQAPETTATGTRRLSIGLCAYSFGYLCGFMGSGTARACADPLNLYRFMDLAAEHQLGGVEFPPLQFLADHQPATLEQARRYAAARGLFIVADGGVVDVAELRQLLPAAAALGATTVRMTASRILCGDRRTVRDSWADYLQEIVRRLKEIRGLAEDLGISVGIENHQDMTSGELVAVCEEVGSPRIGVTLDAINPLAVGEDPLAFARRIAPYLKHVHLKDYFLYKTVDGYRLVRCAVGSGVLDVPALLALCAAEAPAARICIEMGAHEARHIRLLEDDFWPGYPPRRVEDLLPVLRLRETRARPEDEDWRTPWERGEQGDAVVSYETKQFTDSVAYLNSLEGHG
jgi:3-oxoisoapionate decarboxylase